MFWGLGAIFALACLLRKVSASLIPVTLKSIRASISLEADPKLR